MNPKSPQFKALQKKWYNKLAEGGFRDIERGDDNKFLQVDLGARAWSEAEPEVAEHKRRYFELASQLLESYKFKNKRERRLWEMHASGKNIPEIARTLKFSRITASRKIEYLRSLIKV